MKTFNHQDFPLATTPGLIIGEEEGITAQSFHHFKSSIKPLGMNLFKVFLFSSRQPKYFVNDFDPWPCYLSFLWNVQVQTCRASVFFTNLQSDSNALVLCAVKPGDESFWSINAKTNPYMLLVRMLSYFHWTARSTLRPKYTLRKRLAWHKILADQLLCHVFNDLGQTTKHRTLG